MITSVESLPVMILLLGGLAKATAAVAKINAATKNRAVSVFMIQKLTTNCISATEIGGGPAIWIADAHRGDGKRFIVHADEILSAFVELEREVLTVKFYLESVHADSIRRHGVPYPG